MRYFLLVIALSFGGYAWSNDTQKTTPPAPDRHIWSGGQPQIIPTAPDVHSWLSDPRIIISSVPPTINVAVSGKLNMENDNQEPIKWSEWFIVIFTGLLVVVTGYLVFYTKKLWSSTSKLVKGAEDTAQKQLRAYVSVWGVNMIPTEGRIDIDIINTGQTPAFDVTHVAAYCVDVFPKISGFEDVNNNDGAPKGVCGRDQKIPKHMYVSINDDDWQQVIQRKKALYVY